MAGDSRLSARFGADTTDFKNGIAEINREMRVVESGFKASASALGDWGESTNGLQQRIGALNSLIGLQGEKVSALTVKYEDMVAQHGANSVQAQNAQIELSKETEKLNNMRNELGDTTDALNDMESGSAEATDEVGDLGETTEDAGGKAEQSGQKFTGFGGVVVDLVGAVRLGMDAIAGLANAVVGVAKSLVGLVFDAASTAEGLVDLSVKSGISVERLQELAYAGDQLGTSQETMVSSLTRLTRSMASAQKQQENFDAALADGQMEDEISVPIDMANAFNSLGVSFTDSTGKLRDNEDVFADVLDALGKIPNEAERDALSMQLFGKSATELNPLIEAGADEIANLSKQAYEVGAVMGDDAVQGLSDFQDMWDSLTAGLKGIAGSLASLVVPLFQGFTQDALNGLKSFVSIFTASGGDLAATGAAIGGPFGELLTQLGELLPAAISYLQSAWETVLYPALQLVMDWVISTALPTLSQLFSWLGANLPTAIKSLSAFWSNTLYPALLNIWSWIQANLLPLFSTLGTWLGEFLPVYIQTVSIYWTNVLLPAITAFWSWAQANLFPLLQSLFDWLNANLPGALQTVSDFFTNVLQPAMVAVGGWISGTLIPTLSDLFTWLGSTLTTAVQTLSDIWNNTLLPALTVVWGYISTKVIPLFTTLGELLTVTLNVALTALAGIWQNVLQPALEGVWNFMSANILPIFREIGKYLVETFGPTLDELNSGALGTMKTVFNDISKVIQDVITWVEALIKKLQELELPPIFTPGSPTPAEMGLRGIRNEMEALANSAIPSMVRGMNTMQPSAQAATSAAGQAASGAQAASGGTLPSEVKVTVLIQGGTGLEREQARTGVMEAARQVGLA